MSLIIGDNFSYLGAKPLDGRLSYATISAMAGMAASSLYDGIMAFCAETGKEYQWKSANTEDPTLGKWREFTSGGGASSLAGLDDVDLTTPTDGQVFKYDGTNNKWINADEISVPTAYTSNPEMDGMASAGNSTSWAKGDHVHPSDTAKADKVASATNGDFAGLDSNGNLTDSGKTATDFAKILTVADAFDSTAAYNIGDRCTYNGAFYKFTAAHTGAWDAADAAELTINDAILSNTIGIGGGYAPIGTISLILGSTAPQDYLECDGTVYNIADYPQLAAYIESQFGSKNYFGGNGTTTFGVPTIASSVTGTIYCIKAVVAGEVYSTEERKVGTWIDGKPLYQKTIVDTMPDTTDRTKASKTILSDASIKMFVDLRGFLLYSVGISMPFPIVSGGASDSYPEISGRIHTSNSPSNSVSIQNWSSSNSGKTAYITIRYTKTTD